MTLRALLEKNQSQFVPVLPPSWQQAKILLLDLSIDSADFSDINPKDVQALIDKTNSLLKKQKAKLAVGRYAEIRSIYRAHEQFKGRCVHLGVDLTLPPGTKINAPYQATIHSFANNEKSGDYGPTIILEHQLDGKKFFTLYGHLAKRSLAHLQKRKAIKAGECIGHIGTLKENGGWPPHLHFQIIDDMQHNEGDFPGACSVEERALYFNRCPDPNLILQLKI